jgi:hypothetical protein
MRLAGLTKPLEGKEAEDWADAKIVSELPVALAELSHQLRYSRDSDTRAKAARQFIESAGRGKREAAMAGGSPIIILTASGTVEGPWRTAAVKARNVVEGKLVKGTDDAEE